jgi:hypothetical protein
VVMELPPGDADHAPAFDLQDAVAFAITLEGRGGCMCGAAIQLDDQPLGAP